MHAILKFSKFLFTFSVILIVLFLSLLFWKITLANSPDNPYSPPQGINIGVCVNPPEPDINNPSRPIFFWDTYGKDPATRVKNDGNPQQQYWLLVDNNPPVIEPAVYEYRQCPLFPKLGHLSPRCPCDNHARAINCPVTFPATAVDPDICYDWRWWHVWAFSQVYQKILVRPERVYLASPEIDTGAVTSGDKFHELNLGQLPQNQTHYWCVAVKDRFGWTGWTGCNSFFLPNRPPSVKSLIAAPDYCTLTARLTWVFNDPDYKDTQTAYQIQIDNNSDFSSPEIDSEKLNFSSSFYSTDIRHLLPNMTYYWRLRVWDTIGPTASTWFNGPSFITPRHQGPAVNFNWSPGLLLPDDTVRMQFFDRSVVFGGAVKSVWFWTFENGIPPTSTKQNPSVGFASTVNQSNVTLKVTDSSDYTCKATKTVNISGLRIKLREVMPR